MDNLSNFFTMAQYCVPKGFSSALCDDFWAKSIAAGLVLGGIDLGSLLFFITRKVLRRNKQKQGRAEQLRREFEVAPELRMQHAQWKGNALNADVSEAELAQKIKAGLQEKKLLGK